MSINLDKIIMSSLTGQYLNYDNVSEDLTISGNVAAGGGTATFTVTINYTRDNSRADVYYMRTSNNRKTLLNAGNRVNSNIYSFAGFEIVDTILTYSGNSITAGFKITNNTGGIITLTTQVMTISAVIYNAPLSNL